MGYKTKNKQKLTSVNFGREINDFSHSEYSNAKYNRRIRQIEKIKQEKNAKQKNNSPNAKLVPALIVICVTLAVIATAVLIAFWQVSVKAEQAAIRLDSVYSSAYYSLVDNVNNLHVDASKFETIPNVNAQKVALQKMCQDCDYVLASISILPIEAQNSRDITKFFNQIDGVCQALTTKIDKGETLTTDDINKITEASYVLGLVKTNLNDQNELIANADYNIVDSSVFNNKGINEFSSTMGDLSADNIEYPAMIFDGPFSSSLEVKTVNGLTTKKVSQGDALNFLQQLFPQATITYVQKTSGEFETFDFDVVIKKDNFYAQVTERDCFLLTLSGSTSENLPEISDEKAIEIAQTFAEKLKLKNMKAVWVETDENISYINLAPSQNGVILYPDLIKAKIDLTNQTIIGWEARNYAFNHTTREIETQVLEEEALQVLGGDYKLLDSNTAYIPLDNGTESLTYEFVCEKMDGLYYVYVNAANKNIEKVLKVVDTKGVKLLV